MPAGHPGLHSISIEWGDDECYDPTAFVDLTLKTYGSGVASGGGGGGSTHPVLINNTGLAAVPDIVDDEGVPLGPVPIYGASNPGVCLLCNHRMHGGECERGNCDCKAGIPG
jgi:hypothetical protein